MWVAKTCDDPVAEKFYIVKKVMNTVVHMDSRAFTVAQQE